MLNIYDTLSKAKKPLEKTDEPIRLFVCGPTVYDDSHIGHARTYVFFDSFVKYLRSQKYNVFYLQNITDIDDKIINRARERNATTRDLATQYTQEYTRDMQALHATSVDKYEKATDHINKIIEQIQLLIQQDYAYTTPSGVYYRTQKFKNYGQLSGQLQDQLTQTDQDARLYEQDKEHSHDFVIWKISKPNEPEWDSPWGKGRPGWHIEDTAITHSVFGSAQYEVHGGARDLMFPHHEAEIALMESAYTVAPMVDVWMHTGFLNVKNEKMSKSLNNFITIKDILKKHSPETLRLFFLQHHYRSPVDYSEKDIEQTLGLQKRIEDFVWTLIQQIAYSQWFFRDTEYVTDEKIIAPYEQFMQQFHDSLNDDFNTPQALAAMLELISSFNATTTPAHPPLYNKLLTFFKQTNQVFHFISANINKKAIVQENSTSLGTQYLILVQENTFEARYETPNKELNDLLNQREQFRQQKNYSEADNIRQRIEEHEQIQIIDTKNTS